MTKAALHGISRDKHSAVSARRPSYPKAAIYCKLSLDLYGWYGYRKGVAVERAITANARDWCVVVKKEVTESSPSLPSDMPIFSNPPDIGTLYSLTLHQHLVLYMILHALMSFMGFARGPHSTS